MEQSPFCEAKSLSQEIPQILWNLKVHYCVQKGLSPGTPPEPDESSPHLTTQFP